MYPMLVAVSPKSVAFPVVAIVMKSMVLPIAGDPLPAFTPRILLDIPARCSFAIVASPKSVASPFDAMVIKSMVLF